MAAHDDTERLNALFQHIIIGTEINSKIFFYLHEGAIKINIII